MKLAFILLFSLLLTGCATIVGRSDERVLIDSIPSRATFTITDKYGQIAASGTTPQYVVLKKYDGGYFGGFRYTLTLSHPGYSSVNVPLATRLSNWYTFGNLVFLGLPGWLGIDPFSGKMYTLKQNPIQYRLRPCPRGPYFYTCI